MTAEHEKDCDCYDCGTFTNISKPSITNSSIIFNGSYDNPIEFCNTCVTREYSNPNKAIVVVFDNQSFEDSNDLRIRIKGICIEHTKLYPITTHLVENNKEIVEEEAKNFQFKLVMES